jgi:hypothetical protein
MSKTFARLALTFLLAGAAPFAQAQWKDFYIKGGFASPQGDSRDMTHDSKGFTFEGGYVVTPKLWDGEVRFYVGYVKMGGDTKFKPWIQGTDGDGNPVHMDYGQFSALTASEQKAYTITEQKFTYDLTGHTFGIDFAFPFKAFGKNFSVFTGPSLHQWYVVKTNPKETLHERNVKTGWRLGTTYKHDEHLEFSLAYTATEWRSVAEQPFEQGANPSRPCYLSLTAGYRF